MKKILLGITILLLGNLMHSEEIPKNNYQKAIFAGGCFWCMEPPFEKLDGVIDVISGYTDGTGENPTYSDYAKKGHIEAIEITYNAELISYNELLETFWRQIDPTDDQGQFVDRGKEYTTAIFYYNDEQKNLAEKSKSALQATQRFSKPLVTPIKQASTFYKAEDYHQNYYKTHPIKYKWYRWGSGRDKFLNKIWKK